MKKIILIISFFIALQASAQNTFHVIMSIDRYSNIAESCKIDYQNISKDFKAISSSLGMEYKEYDINFTTEESRDFINNFICDPTDIVFYYYSGHGYRYGDQKTVWPYLNICKSEEDECGVSLDWVHKQLIEKKPKMSISIGDCCNSLVDGNEPKTYLSRNRSLGSSAAGYEALFNQEDVHIVASGSLPGEYSLGTDVGGIYTNNLLSVIKRSKTSASVTWKDVLYKAKKKANEESDKEQSPHFMIKSAGKALYSEGEYPNTDDETIPEELVNPDEWTDGGEEWEEDYTEAENAEEELYDIALIIVMGLYADDADLSDNEYNALNEYFEAIFSEMGYAENSGSEFITFLGDEIDNVSDEDFELWFNDSFDFLTQVLSEDEANAIYSSIEEMVDNPDQEGFVEYMLSLRE